MAPSSRVLYIGQMLQSQAKYLERIKGSAPNANSNIKLISLLTIRDLKLID